MIHLFMRKMDDTFALFILSCYFQDDILLTQKRKKVSVTEMEEVWNSGHGKSHQIFFQGKSHRHGLLCHL